MATLTPPLKWAGGKNYLARRIVGLMPPHLHYVEPYFGGGAVLLERDPNDPRLFAGDTSSTRGVSELVNDLNGELINFWRVLRGPETFPAFARLCQATELGREVWKASGRPRPGESDVERAWRFFVAARQSHAGTFKGFTSITRSRVRRGVNGNASEWLGAVDGLPAVHARLRPVVVEGPTDALELIAREDTPGTFFYLDPPYLHSTRATKDLYAHEADKAHHANLLVRLGGRAAADALAGLPDDPHPALPFWPDWWAAARPLKGKFLLSGYDSPMYAAAERACGWRRVEFDMPNHQAGGAEKRRTTEVVWANYEPPNFLPLGAALGSTS